MMLLAPFVATIALLLFGTTPTQKPARPDVPPTIAAPPNEDVVLVAHASGSQIYVCQVGTDQKPSWTLKAPDAELSDASGKNIGHHSAGPTWRLTDGSEVTGKADAREDAPDAGAIPWLRLKVIGHSGNGPFAKVTTIQRIHTKGGQPPAAGCGCDDSHRDAEYKSPYSADYYFYGPRTSSRTPVAHLRCGVQSGRSPLTLPAESSSGESRRLCAILDPT